MRRILVLAVLTVGLALPVASSADGLQPPSAASACVPIDWYPTLGPAVLGLNPPPPCMGPDDARAADLCRPDTLPQPQGWALAACPAGDPATTPPGQTGPPAGPGKTTRISGDCGEAVVPVASMQMAYFKGGEWHQSDDQNCMFMSYYVDEFVPGLTSRSIGVNGFGPDITAGTKISLRLVFDGSRPPNYTVLTMRNATMALSGNEVQIQGEATDTRVPVDYHTVELDGECGPSQTLPGRFDATVFLEPDAQDAVHDDDILNHGGWYATNGLSFSWPRFEGDDLVAELAGCGDGDDTTADGFFEGFIPAARVAAMGAAPLLRDAVAGGVADAAIDAFSDGRRADAALESVDSSDLALARVPGQKRIRLRSTKGAEGITVAYETSFSRHRLVLRPRAWAMRTVRSCLKRHGKVKLRKHHLVCKRR